MNKEIRANNKIKKQIEFNKLFSKVPPVDLKKLPIRPKLRAQRAPKIRIQRATRAPRAPQTKKTPSGNVFIYINGNKEDISYQRQPSHRQQPSHHQQPSHQGAEPLEGAEQLQSRPPSIGLLEKKDENVKVPSLSNVSLTGDNQTENILLDVSTVSSTAVSPRGGTLGLDELLAKQYDIIQKQKKIEEEQPSRIMRAEEPISQFQASEPPEVRRRGQPKKEDRAVFNLQEDLTLNPDEEVERVSEFQNLTQNETTLKLRDQIKQLKKDNPNISSIQKIKISETRYNDLGQPEQRFYTNAELKEKIDFMIKERLKEKRGFPKPDKDV